MIYTFGHSTQTEEEAADVLNSVGIDILVDARSHPTSRLPQWQIENLKKWVREAGLQYEWFKGLGGWTPRYHKYVEYMEGISHTDLSEYMMGVFPKHIISRKMKLEPDQGLWTTRGFYDYQFVMILPEFYSDIDDLIDMGTEKDVAFMCSEFLWWKCHRSMIADYLWLRGTEVRHIQPRISFHDAADRIGRYHPYVRKCWEMHARMNGYELRSLAEA